MMLHVEVDAAFSVVTNLDQDSLQSVNSVCLTGSRRPYPISFRKFLAVKVQQ